jgi:hypothetical protein
MPRRQNQDESAAAGFIPIGKITMQLAGETERYEEAYAFGCLAFGGETAFEKMLPHMSAEGLAPITDLDADLFGMRFHAQRDLNPTFLNGKIRDGVHGIIDEAEKNMLDVRADRKYGDGLEVHSHINAEASRAIAKEAPGAIDYLLQINDVFIHFLATEGQYAFHKFPAMARGIGEVQIALTKMQHFTDLLHFRKRQLTYASP